MPYFVVCEPNTLESVAFNVLLFEKTLDGSNVLRPEKPFPAVVLEIVGPLPLVTVKGNWGNAATMSGELSLLSRPVTLLGTSPKEYEPPNSQTVVGDCTQVTRPTCVRPGESLCVVETNGCPKPPLNRPIGSTVGIVSLSYP